MGNYLVFALLITLVYLISFYFYTKKPPEEKREKPPEEKKKEKEKEEKEEKEERIIINVIYNNEIEEKDIPDLVNYYFNPHHTNNAINHEEKVIVKFDSIKFESLKNFINGSR